MKHPELKGLSIAEYHKAWNKLTKYKTVKSMHKNRFGGMREAVLERDKYRCVMCNMTMERHLKLFNRSLTINHINGMGRNLSEIGLVPYNDIDNLETLCLRCHGHVDEKRAYKVNCLI